MYRPISWENNFLKDFSAALTHSHSLWRTRTRHTQRDSKELKHATSYEWCGKNNGQIPYLSVFLNFQFFFVCTLNFHIQCLSFSSKLSVLFSLCFLFITLIRSLLHFTQLRPISTAKPFLKHSLSIWPLLCWIFDSRFVYLFYWTLCHRVSVNTIAIG